MAEKEEFLLKLKDYLITNYPEDDNIKLWFPEYSEKFGNNKLKPVHKRTRSFVKQEVRNKLLQSYSEERRIEGDVGIHTDTEDKCAESIKKLEVSIKSHKRDIIYKSALQ